MTDDKETVEFLKKCLRIAAGLISTMDQFKDKHPQEAYDQIIQWAREDSLPDEPKGKE